MLSPDTMVGMSMLKYELLIHRARRNVLRARVLMRMLGYLVKKADLIHTTLELPDTGVARVSSVLY